MNEMYRILIDQSLYNCELSINNMNTMDPKKFHPRTMFNSLRTCCFTIHTICRDDINVNVKSKKKTHRKGIVLFKC